MFRRTDSFDTFPKRVQAMPMLPMIGTLGRCFGDESTRLEQPINANVRGWVMAGEAMTALSDGIEAATKEDAVGSVPELGYAAEHSPHLAPSEPPEMALRKVAA